jgi:hypothetical protein
MSRHELPFFVSVNGQRTMSFPGKIGGFAPSKRGVCGRLFPKNNMKLHMMDKKNVINFFDHPKSFLPILRRRNLGRPPPQFK